MDSYEQDSCIRGCHIYQNIWTAEVDEHFVCEREPLNSSDKYVVAVLKDNVCHSVTSMILLEGQQSFMVKLDIKEAYRIVPIHPQDQPLIGVMWEDSESVYIYKMLPFSLRSAPKIFLAITDTIQWF